MNNNKVADLINLKLDGPSLVIPKDNKSFLKYSNPPTNANTYEKNNKTLIGHTMWYKYS